MHRLWLRWLTGIGGGLLTLGSLLLAYAELGHALQGSRGAWIAFIVVLLTASLGGWLVARAWRGATAPGPRVAV